MSGISRFLQSYNETLRQEIADADTPHKLTDQHRQPGNDNWAFECYPGASAREYIFRECVAWRVYSGINGTAANVQNAGKPVTNNIYGEIASVPVAIKNGMKNTHGKPIVYGIGKEVVGFQKAANVLIAVVC